MSLLVRDIIDKSGKDYENLTAIKWLKKKEIQEKTYGDLVADVIRIREGLSAEGFLKSHIALIGSNCVEWMEAFLGVVTGSTVAVPLDAGMPKEELTDLINRSDSQGLFLGAKQKALLPEFLEKCPNLKKIWILQETELDLSDARVSSLEALMREGEGQKDAERPLPEYTALIIYTSGTTGLSKGVMLSQGNLAANVEAISFASPPGVTILSVLPIHHAFCLVMDWLRGFDRGAILCINDSMMHMVRNIGIFKPQSILMVPLMVETIFKRIDHSASPLPKAELAKEMFGGRLHYIFTGGAHLEDFYVERFAEFGVTVLEGYGMSECSPVISANMPEAYKVGSVGKPIANVELGFENGEILVRGSSVMKEYYKMPEETKETLRDGWLHTGDRGYLDEDGFLFITGRIKNLIILSNGENISPEQLENKLALNDLIQEIIITGENGALTARIYPNPDKVDEENLKEEEVRERLQKILDEFNGNQPTYRRITGLVVRKNPFIKSATKKIKRQFVEVDEAEEN